LEIKESLLKRSYCLVIFYFVRKSLLSVPSKQNIFSNALFYSNANTQEKDGVNSLEQVD
jgi:hypothetical protein